VRSQDTLAPHLSVPFRLSATGAHVEVDEQDTPDEIRGCVYNVLVTPIGHRAELPEFGIADPTFRMAGASLEDIEAAVEQWEPRADVLLDEDPDYLDTTVRRVRVYA
jgi:phage baseplate assembly protein W